MLPLIIQDLGSSIITALILLNINYLSTVHFYSGTNSTIYLQGQIK